MQITNDYEILKAFLKLGFSTRMLDKLLGFNQRTSKGWVSWNILKKYKLINEDKGKLFLYTDGQCRSIIKRIMKSNANINSLIKDIEPKTLDKYKDTFVLAKSGKDFYNILSGETRNIIKNFFSSFKKIVGTCQIDLCKKSKLDTVHLKEERPIIFIKCSENNKEKIQDNFYKFNVFETMKCFLKAHKRKGYVCFLCKEHHQQLHNLEKSSKEELRDFKKRIIF
ncbi:MAG: hypothetical protein WC307_05630 [Candidatus Nanoarchaeia archaeon]|jgi:hypothetical protein